MKKKVYKNVSCSPEIQDVQDGTLMYTFFLMKTASPSKNKVKCPVNRNVCMEEL